MYYKSGVGAQEPFNATKYVAAHGGALSPAFLQSHQSKAPGSADTPFPASHSAIQARDRTR